MVISGSSWVEFCKASYANQKTRERCFRFHGRGFLFPQGDCNRIEICILEMLVGLWKREAWEQLVFGSLLLQINFQFLLPELELHEVRKAVIFMLSLSS